MKKFLVLFLISFALFACNSERKKVESTDVRTIYDSANKTNVVIVKDDNGNDLLMDYLVYQSLLNSYGSPYAARNYYVRNYDNYRYSAPKTIVNNNYHYNTSVSTNNTHNLSNPTAKTANVSVPITSTKPTASVNGSIDASKLKTSAPTTNTNNSSWFRSSTKSTPIAAKLN